jgi:hypothetical protein
LKDTTDWLYRNVHHVCPSDVPTTIFGKRANFNIIIYIAFLTAFMLPGYKQVMRHKNYLPFIPEQYRCDQLYCKPSKEVLDAEERDQKERSQYKKMKKAAELEVMT